MRKESATIKVALRATLNKDKKQSIVLRIQYRGVRKDKNLGISVRKKDWSETTKRVKKTNSNFSQFNDIIERELKKAKKIELEYQHADMQYTADMIMKRLNNDNVVNTKPQTLTGLMETFFDECETPLTYATKSYYISSVKSFLKYLNVKDIELLAIDKKMINDYYEWLTKSDLKGLTQYNYYTHIKELFSFAVAEEYISNTPFRKKHKFNTSTTPKSLTQKQLELLVRYWYSLKYDEIKKNLHNPFSKEFIFTFFLCGYNMQGLAPIDMLFLSNKMRQTLLEREQGGNVMIFKTYRKKTHKKVVITIYKNETQNKLYLAPFIQRLENGKEYLFPFFDTVNPNNEEEVFKQRKHFYGRASVNLKEVWKEFNKWLEDTVNEQKIDLGVTAENIDLYKIDKSITLYSYRHTYASIFIANGGSAEKLAKDMGRNIGGIDTYVDTLPSPQKERDIERFEIMNI